MDIQVITQYGPRSRSRYKPVGQHRLTLTIGESRFYVMIRMLIAAVVLALVASACAGAGGRTWGPVDNPASGGPSAVWLYQADG